MTKAQHEATIVADRILARNIRYAWCETVQDISVQKLADRVSPRVYSDAELCEAASVMSSSSPHAMRDKIARLKSEIEIEAEHLRSLTDIPGRLTLEFEMADLGDELKRLRQAVVEAAQR